MLVECEIVYIDFIMTLSPVFEWPIRYLRLLGSEKCTVWILSPITNKHASRKHFGPEATSFFLKPFSHFEKHNSPVLVELVRKPFYFLCTRPYIVCHYESVYALICDVFTLKKYLANICCIILLVDFLESWRVVLCAEHSPEHGEQWSCTL